MYGFDGKDNYCKKCNVEKIKELANYSTRIRKRLSYAEELRSDPNNPKKLQVRCATCFKWTNPTKSELYARISALEGNASSLGSENHFYCSDQCKQACPVYGQKNHRRDHKSPTNNNSRPHQKEWRDLVLQCGEYRCQMCGKIVDDEKELTAHHIDPVVCNPIESIDVDNGVLLCSKCDDYVHSKIPGCTRADLSKFGKQCAVEY